MIKNSKGFMLAEAVITSTVVLTAMISLFATFSKIYSLYKVRETYYDVDGVYVIEGFVNHSLEDNLFNNLALKLDSNNYIELVKDGVVKESNCDTYCSSLKSAYNIESMYMIKYDSSRIAILKDISGINATFSDYLDYVLGNYDWNSGDYVYMIILEYGSDVNNLYYASMGIG